MIGAEVPHHIGQVHGQHGTSGHPYVVVGVYLYVPLELFARAVEVVFQEVGVHKGSFAEVAGTASQGLEAPSDVVVDELVYHFAEYEHVKRLRKPARYGTHRPQ